MSTTKRELEACVKELHDALIENMEASRAEEEGKLRSTKARYRLNKAKEALRDIEFS